MKNFQGQEATPDFGELNGLFVMLKLLGELIHMRMHSIPSYSQGVFWMPNDMGKIIINVQFYIKPLFECPLSYIT